MFKGADFDYSIRRLFYGQYKKELGLIIPVFFYIFTKKLYTTDNSLLAVAEKMMT